MIEAPFWLKHARLSILDEQEVIPRRPQMPIMSRDEIRGFETALENNQREIVELRHALCSREQYESALAKSQQELAALKVLVDEDDDDKAHTLAHQSNA